jgi:hypothetical protein
MTLVDALAGLQEGALPTNEQSLAFLSQVISSFPPPKDLSEPGKGFIADTRTVFESLEKIVAHRNTEEELQEFLWRTRGAAGQLGKDGLKFRWGKQVDEDKTKKEEKKDKKKGSAKASVVAAGQVVQRDSVQGELWDFS